MHVRRTAEVKAQLWERGDICGSTRELTFWSIGHIQKRSGKSGWVLGGGQVAHSLMSQIRIYPVR